MIQGLRTVTYPVSDMERATAWYAQVFETDPYFQQPYYVGFSVGGFELGLVPDGQPGSAGATAYWGTPDAAAEVARVLALGATLDTDVTDVGDGIRIATVRDPDGNLIGIVENPGFDPAAVR